MNLRLTDLDPEWLRYEGDPKSFRRVESRSDANGILFVCPLCYENNGHQRPGVHGVICWDCSVPADVTPGPGRWKLDGDSFETLTLNSCPDKSRSVLLTGPGCAWHGFITNGVVT